MSNIIDGKEIAALRQEKLAAKLANLAKPPRVVSILVGDDPASCLYVKVKQKKAAELGIKFEIVKLPVDTNFYQVTKTMISFNEDPEIDGIMIQLPLPGKFLGTHKSSELTGLIAPGKDVDGLTGHSFFTTAAVEAVMAILEEEQIEVKGKYAVIVGSSELIGLSIAKKLEASGAMVKVCDSKTKDLAEFTKRADILVTATGVPGLIKGNMVKEGVVVIDVGVMIMEEESDGQTQEKVMGDVDFKSVEPKASKITPVPGGVGPVTVISLMENVALAVDQSHPEGV